jgi:hypothetical protein
VESPGSKFFGYAWLCARRALVFLGLGLVAVAHGGVQIINSWHCFNHKNLLGNKKSGS